VSDTATARSVGPHTQLGPAWTRLPTNPERSREAADRALAECQVDPTTGLWPSGRGPSPSWQRLIKEAAAAATAADEEEIAA